jgi:hypothetical protein
MKRIDAGIASTARGPLNETISPAARKFAEYLARRLRPMIESAQEEPPAVKASNARQK